jgi:hypothetical protein
MTRQSVVLPRSAQCRTPTAVYQFEINDRPVRVDKLAGHADVLLSYYLSIPGLGCCDVRGGYVIKADGTVVMGLTDHVSMSATWLPAIIRLQRGARSTGLWPWEESHMTLTRDGDCVTMVDVHSSGVVCPPIRFLFGEFVRAMVRASRPLVPLFDEFHIAREAHLAAARADDNEEMIRVLELLGDEVSPDWPRQIAECEKRMAMDARALDCTTKCII